MIPEGSPPKCRHGWEALRSDPLPWLLDEAQPSAAWQTLIEIVGRPADSVAVARARGRANVTPPISNLLRPLNPDGTWVLTCDQWDAFAGGAWRLAAATQLGADPSDPRLQTAAERFLDAIQGDGGFTQDPRATARLLAAFAKLGWRSHPRFVEALAWIEHKTSIAPDDGKDACLSDGESRTSRIVAAAVLQTLESAAWLDSRAKLAQWARDTLLEYVGVTVGSQLDLRMPNLLTTDRGEALWSLVLSGCDLPASAAGSLRLLQKMQDEKARWTVTEKPEQSLELGGFQGLSPEEPCPWLSVRSVRTLLASAVSCKLPRVFPAKP
ncbi:MAG: terpene cyclase/mutase family protein [bacterium]|nr:terpene cyclase/mutase family protein [bacterium]